MINYMTIPECKDCPYLKNYIRCSLLKEDSRERLITGISNKECLNAKKRKGEK